MNLFRLSDCAGAGDGATTSPCLARAAFSSRFMQIFVSRHGFLHRVAVKCRPMRHNLITRKPAGRRLLPRPCAAIVLLMMGEIGSSGRHVKPGPRPYQCTGFASTRRARRVGMCSILSDPARPKSVLALATVPVACHARPAGYTTRRHPQARQILLAQPQSVHGWVYKPSADEVRRIRSHQSQFSLPSKAPHARQCRAPSTKPRTYRTAVPVTSSTMTMPLTRNPLRRLATSATTRRRSCRRIRMTV